MRSHHSRHTRLPDPAPQEPGTNADLTARLLEGRDTFYQDTASDVHIWCAVCGSWIPPGHTLLELAPSAPGYFSLCWSCGCAILAALGRISQDPEDWPPPLGAPRKVLSSCTDPTHGSTCSEEIP